MNAYNAEPTRKRPKWAPLTLHIERRWNSTYVQQDRAYYIRLNDDETGEPCFEKVKGERAAEIPQWDFFTYQDDRGDWVVSDAVTGMRVVARGTKEDAIYAALDLLNRTRYQSVGRSIDNEATKPGCLSPRYIRETREW